MTKEEIEVIIAQNIRTNGRGEITARVMAGVLYDFVAYVDTSTDDFEELVRAMADAYSALVEEMEGKFEDKADALEAAFEAFSSALLTDQFEPWADALARALTAKMNDAKAAADDAKTAALDAKASAQSAAGKSDDAKTAALEGKAAAQTASGKADDAKTAAVDAKTAAQSADTKAGEAKAAALEAKSAAQTASGKADDAKTASLEGKAEATLAKTAANGAKNAIDAAADGIVEALAIIRAGNQNPIFFVEDGIAFGGSTFQSVPNNFDFSRLTVASNLFKSCESLQAAPLAVFENMATEGLFGYCSALTSVDGLVIKDNTRKIHRGMFSFCFSLANVPEGVLELSGDCSRLFASCSNLETVHIKVADVDSDYDSTILLDLTAAFLSCSKLRQITFDASEMGRGGIDAQAQTFESCPLLLSLPTSLLEACVKLTLPKNMMDLQAFDASKLLYFGDGSGEDLALVNVGAITNLNPYYIYLNKAKNLTLASLQNIVNALGVAPSTRRLYVSSESMAIMQADTTVYTYDGNNYVGLVALATAKGWTVSA